MKQTDYPNPHTASRQAGHIGGIIPMFVRIGGLHVRSKFGVFENLTIYVLLSTSFIDHCIWGIFPCERRVVPWPSCSVLIISSSPTVSSVFSDVSISNVHSAHDAKSSKGKKDKDEEELHLCLLSRRNCDTSIHTIRSKLQKLSTMSPARGSRSQRCRT